MLQVSNLKKSYGARVLFEDVSFSIASGDVVGLVGRNGCGKSTLFKIIQGTEISDSGEVHTPKGYRLGFLDQHIHFTKATVIEECCTALPQGQEQDQYKAEAFLFGLGFTKENLERAPSEFSGGYQLRINLVKALLKEPDLLLLDEPTNYLDILSLTWLRKFIKSFAGEVIIITHDRDFMDSVVTHTLGINRQRVKKIAGPTEKYYEQLIMEEEIHEKTRKNQEKKVKEMQDFVERFRAKATKAKQAQSRMKQIQKMSVLGELMKEASLGFRFHFKDTPAKKLLSVEDLSFGYNEGQPLFQNLSFEAKPGDRIAIIGKNGYGKTTLLNVIAGQLQGEGEIKGHPDTTLGYYQQTNKKKLSPNYSVYDEISSDNPELSISAVRAICGAMMFPGDDADKKISVLSGGEQGRVLLGKVIAKPCNVLLLDEPTNHLDMESIQVMTEEIDRFPGAVLLVTHDEALLRQVATKLIVFKNGRAQLFLGDYDEFLQKEGWGEALVAKKAKPKVDQKVLKRKRAEIVQKRSKLLKPLKKENDELEAEIMSLEEELEAKNKRLPDIPLDSPEMKEHFQRTGQIQMKLATHYTRLDEILQAIEEITSNSEQELELLSQGLN